MIAELEIRQRLIEFMSKPESLDDFEDWLVGQSWNMHADASEDAQKLVSFIELRLAEYSGGHMDFDSLRREFVPYVTDLHGEASTSPNPCAIPYETHRGKLEIGGIVLDVVQLSDGQRVITEESLSRFFESMQESQ